VVAEADGVRGALARYRTAFSALDAEAAMRVWPTVNQRNLTRAFDRLREQEVSFEACQIDVMKARAEANCSGSIRYVPRVGGQTVQVDRRVWRFSLLKNGDE
jgi:hypothetical protein